MSEIERLIDRRDLEVVAPSEAHAALLMEQAAGHLEAAGSLLHQHPPSAYALLYDAARKAMAAVLARQGLRATSQGGHLVVQEAIEAQMGPNVRHVVRSFRQLRKRRHESEYPRIEDLPISANEAVEALADAGDIVDRMRTFLPLLGPFRP